jgi:hypothetical protein
MFILRNHHDTTNGRIQRWAISLETFNATFVHVPAEKNELADILSRLELHSPIVRPVVRTRFARLDTDAESDPFIMAATAVLNGTDRDAVGLDPGFLELARNVKERLSLVTVGGAKQLYFTDLHSISRRRVIPAATVSLIIDMHHGNMMVGHWGVDITLRRLQRHCWWPTMEEDVARYVTYCDPCQRAKSSKGLDTTAHREPQGLFPLDCVHIDIMPMSGVSLRENRVLLTMTDRDTRYNILVPLPDHTVETVVDAVFTYLFFAFGFPLEIVSDREFERTLLQEINERLLILHSMTAPYDPAGNGMAERPHKDINALLAAFGATEQDWDRFIPMIMFQLNSRFCKAIGMSPFLAMFGREPLSPLDFSLENRVNLKLVISPVEWRKLRQSHLALRRDLDDQNFEARKKRVEKKAGKARVGLAAKVDDLVLLRVDPRFASVKSGGKFEGKWIGPFRVLSTSRGSLEISAVHLVHGAVVTRHARDWKLYFTDAEDDDLRADGEFIIRQVKGVRGPLDDREYLVAWEGYPDEFDSWRPARDMLPETIDEAEKEFGGAGAPEISSRVDARSPDAGVSSPSADQLVAERVSFNPAPSTVPGASEWISDDFIIVSTRNTRRAGRLYIIRRAGQPKDESVQERRIPPHRRVPD